MAMQSDTKARDTAQWSSIRKKDEKEKKTIKIKIKHPVKQAI